MRLLLSWMLAGRGHNLQGLPACIGTAGMPLAVRQERPSRPGTTALPANAQSVLQAKGTASLLLPLSPKSCPLPACHLPQSRMCDAPAFVRQLEGVYQQLWQRWVSQQRQQQPEQQQQQQQQQQEQQQQERVQQEEDAVS